MSDTILNATARQLAGKGASRRLRRLNNEIPAIIYGLDKEPESISILHKEIYHAVQDESFFSSIISLVVDGASQQVLLKDLQRHPAKDILMHADFLRVDANTAIIVNVPLHFLNEEECPGVKNESGNAVHGMTEIEISCLPAELPESIDVDLAGMSIGDAIHVSELKLPAGLTIPQLESNEEYGDIPVVSIQASRANLDDEEAEGEAAEEAPASEESDKED
jgi:large subunit ribosomal protein L25